MWNSWYSCDPESSAPRKTPEPRWPKWTPRRPTLKSGRTKRSRSARPAKNQPSSDRRALEAKSSQHSFAPTHRKNYGINRSESERPSAVQAENPPDVAADAGCYYVLGGVLPVAEPWPHAN